MFFKIMMMLILLVLTTSCGERSKGDTKSVTHFRSPSFDGNYDIIFEALNEEISGEFDARGKLNIQSNIFSIEIDAKTSPRESLHIQNLYNVERCPDLRDDMNRDGFIDSLEIHKKLGAALIPLDDDLSEQLKGYDTFPGSDSLGKYNYRKSTNFSLLLEDLLRPDPNVEDYIKKLQHPFGLNFKKSVIIIYGVNPSTYIPETIWSLGNLNTFLTFPIACGQIISRFD